MASCGLRPSRQRVVWTNLSVAFVALLLACIPSLSHAQTNAAPTDPAPVVTAASSLASNAPAAAAPARGNPPIAPAPGPVVMPPLSTPPPGSSVPSAASTPAPDDTLAPAAPVTPAPSDASTPAPPPFTSQSPIPRSAALPAQPQIPTGATPATQPPGSANDEQLADVRPPFLHSNFWTYFWLALLGLAVFALLIWLALNRRGRPVSAKTAYELTLEKLEKARALLNEENPVPYAVSISEAIRSYLGLRFAAPSTRRTTEEFLRQMESDPTTPLAGHRDLLREFLQSCDLVKFARYQPNLGELEQVQQRAYNFVTATKPVEMADHRSRA